MTKLDMSYINDFTTSHYIELLRIAKANYKFVRYQDIMLTERFILWRHDCDSSLNRSLQLAKIENEEEVKSTYFLNPHSEFYNLMEQSQSHIIEKIITLGRDIGLHFDCNYYDIQTETELDDLVAKEATWLKDWFGVTPVVFSFHNPTELFLSYERDTYGGLLNCYSKTFKDNIPYCSDSNGYWRFRRLRNVLESANDSCLQVLTHPGSWQDKPMYPRERIFRSIYGRAKYTINFYDEGLETHGRDNLAGSASNIRFIKQLDVDRYHLYDYLWNNNLLQSLYIELYRLHEHQITQICKIRFCKGGLVSPKEVDDYFKESNLVLDGWRLFQIVFDKSLAQVCDISEDIHKKWIKVFNQLVRNRTNISSDKLEEGCIYLCNIIKTVSNWGLIQESIQYDGITYLDESGVSIHNTNKDNLTETIQKSSNVAWIEFCRWVESNKKI